MATDMFLKLDGIKGESKDKQHKDEIQIESFSWGMAQHTEGHTGGGHGAGKVRIHDISISKSTDKASADLIQQVCTGKHIKEGLITFRKAGDKPLEYLKIKLTDVFISNYQVGSSAGSDVPSESITLNFTKFQAEYFEQKPDGSGTSAGNASWDVKTHSKV